MVPKAKRRMQCFFLSRSHAKFGTIERAIEVIHAAIRHIRSKGRLYPAICRRSPEGRGFNAAAKVRTRHHGKYFAPDACAVHRRGIAGVEAGTTAAGFFPDSLAAIIAHGIALLFHRLVRSAGLRQRHRRLAAGYFGGHELVGLVQRTAALYCTNNCCFEAIAMQMTKS